MTTDTHTRYVQSGKGTIKQIGDETAIFVKEQKGLHVLNDTALLIYEALAQPVTERQVVQVLGELTGAPTETIEADVSRTVALYLQYGLIEDAG